MAGIAQSTSSAQNQSRLNMAYKKTPTSINKKLNAVPYSIDNQPLILKVSKALGSYYKALLFGETTTHETAVSLEQVSPAAPSVAVSKESKFEQLENHTDENEYLYSSEKINVRNLYPNPASENTYLEYTISSTIKEAKIAFFNVLGATIKEYSLNKNSQKLTIDTRSMPNGVYFYQLTVDGQKVATKKLLVRHHQ